MKSRYEIFQIDPDSGEIIKVLKVMPADDKQTPSGQSTNMGRMKEAIFFAMTTSKLASCTCRIGLRTNKIGNENKWDDHTSTMGIFKDGEKYNLIHNCEEIDYEKVIKEAEATAKIIKGLV